MLFSKGAVKPTLSRRDTRKLSPSLHWTKGRAEHAGPRVPQWAAGPGEPGWQPAQQWGSRRHLTHLWYLGVARL